MGQSNKREACPTKTDNNVTIVFMSAKRGGILQCSGFLTLKSLLALSQTCKAHTIDASSLVMLIENEVTRDHGVRTVDEAMAFWKDVYSNVGPLTKEWLELGLTNSHHHGVSMTSDTTDDTDTCNVSTGRSVMKSISSDMISDGVRYDVMLSNMLRAVPQSEERLQLVSTPDPAYERTALHNAARDSNLKSMQMLLALYPESQHVQAVIGARDRFNRTVRHYAALSGNLELIQFILRLLPESQLLQAVTMKDAFGITALHNVVRSGDVTSIKTVLTLCCPESERLKIFGSTIDDDGRTILHHAALLGKLELIEFIVSLLSVDERMFLVMVRDKKLQSVLHVATSLDNFEAITFTLALLKDTQRFFIVYRKDQDGRTVLHHLALNSQQSQLIETVVSMLHESHRSKAVNIQDRKGATVLQLVSQPLRERLTQMTIQHRAAADGSKFTPTITLTDHLLTLKYSNQHSK